MKRTILNVLSVFVILQLAIGLNGCRGTKQKKEDVEERVPVKVMTVELGRVVQSLSYNGDIEAEYEVKVFSKIPDRIEVFFVDEGDYVAQGDPIAKIASTAIEQGVRQAEAALAAAKAQEANLRVEYERAKRLSMEDAMSRQQLEAIKTQYEAIQAQVQQAEAALATAKSKWKDATVTAPVSGIIGKKFLEVGDMAAPQLPLVTVVQMNRVKIGFDVTENDYGKIKVGQEAQVSVRSYPDEIFKGRVHKISPVLDPITRMARVEVLVNNRDRRLKPGMFADVKVIVGVLDNVITIPRYATIESTSMQRLGGENRVVKKYYVFIVENDRAIRRELDVKYVNHRFIAVNSGVEIGDQLVIEGQNNLRDSVAVSIIKEGSET